MENIRELIRECLVMFDDQEPVADEVANLLTSAFIDLPNLEDESETEAYPQMSPESFLTIVQNELRGWNKDRDLTNEIEEILSCSLYL